MVQQLECKQCDVIQQENIHFVRSKERCAYRQRSCVLDLCRTGTKVVVAKKVYLLWNKVKVILELAHSRKFSCPDINGMRYIGFDEIAVADRHVYMTFVVNLKTGRLVYVGNGKGADGLDDLRPKLSYAG